VADDAEGKCDEPHDREAEHSEEHPGPDRPGRGLAREGRAAARVDHERCEERDLREHPEEVVQAFEALRTLNLGRVERVARVR
jgi:hypothetical protein